MNHRNHVLEAIVDARTAPRGQSARVHAMLAQAAALQSLADAVRSLAPEPIEMTVEHVEPSGDLPELLCRVGILASMWQEGHSTREFIRGQKFHGLADALDGVAQSYAAYRR